jgi:hypothetical protein
MGVRLPTPEEIENLMRNLDREAQHAVEKETTDAIAPQALDEVEEEQSEPVLAQDPAAKNSTQTLSNKTKRK